MKKFLGIVCVSLLILGVAACKKAPTETQAPASETPAQMPLEETPVAPGTPETSVPPAMPVPMTMPSDTTTGAPAMTPPDTMPQPPQNELQLPPYSGSGTPSIDEQKEHQNGGIVPPGTPNSGY